MSETPDSGPSDRSLAARLQLLRTGWDSGPLSQEQLASALGVSAPLVSSWENGRAVPPAKRLQAYARFFVTPRSFEGGVLRLLPPAELTAEENRRREQLETELLRLREGAPRPRPSESPTWSPPVIDTGRGNLGGRFWHFPPDSTATVFCTDATDRQFGLELAEPPAWVQYSDVAHPNYISLSRNADIDSLVELAGHIRAENPSSRVRWGLAREDVRSPDWLSDHLVILGQVEGNLWNAPNDVLAWVHRQLSLPVYSRLPASGDAEFGTEFVVRRDTDGRPHFGGETKQVFRPSFLHRDVDGKSTPVLVNGLPQLDYDLGLVVRKPNPVDSQKTVTLCGGIFSRGTYGMVRLFTDKNVRDRNWAYVEDTFDDPGDFWMLLKVPVALGQTLTPELGNPELLLASSASES